MIRIVVPSCGNSEFFHESYYPKTLYEVKGQPMIQHVVNNFKSLSDKRFIFVFLQSECDKFHTDNISLLLTEGEADVIRLKEVTGGALCSCLMAVEYIDNKDELIITNNDQIIDEDFQKIVMSFRQRKCDAGVVCFNTLHPRWSYVRTIGENVVEAAEKRPISHRAIAGVYYYKHGHDYVEMAKNAIRKGSMHDGKYYITSVINEMILRNKKVGFYDIEKEMYHSFYTPERVRNYENGEE